MPGRTSGGVRGLAPGRGDESEGVRRIPLCGSRHDSKLAAVLVGEDGRRQAERLAVALQRLENIGRAVGVEAEIFDGDLLQKRFRSVQFRGVDVDRHDGEIRAAARSFKAIESRHLLPAGHAPGRPQV